MIVLQPFQRNDYARLINWVDDAESLMQFAGPAFTFPLTPAQLDASLADENRHVFKAVDATTNTTVGHAELYLGPHSAFLGRILIGEKEQRGKGLGELIVRELLTLAFLKFKQPKAELNVFVWNTPAIRCYEKLGFVINPTKAFERTLNGKTWKGVNMQLQRQSFLERLQTET